MFEQVRNPEVCMQRCAHAPTSIITHGSPGAPGSSVPFFRDKVLYTWFVRADVDSLRFMGRRVHDT